VKRKLFNLTAAASVTLAVLLAAMWHRSAAVHDRFRFNLPQSQYTVHSHNRRLTLAGPPAPDGSAAAGERAAWELVRRVRNDQLRWDEYQHTRGRTVVGRKVEVHVRRGTPAAQAADRDPAALTRPLLKAFQDPDRFVAAHVLLSSSGRPGAEASAGPADAGGTVRCACDHLTIELLPDGVGNPDGNALVFSTHHEHRAPQSWRADPAQRKALRDLWHDRRDVPIGSASHGWFVAAAMALPAAWLWSWWRTASRERMGLCVRCGYDLRENRDTCPECGAPTVPPEHAAA
jgi:hypothetical protein